LLIRSCWKRDQLSPKGKKLPGGVNTSIRGAVQLKEDCFLKKFPSLGHLGPRASQREKVKYKVIGLQGHKGKIGIHNDDGSRGGRVHDLSKRKSVSCSTRHWQTGGGSLRPKEVMRHEVDWNLLQKPLMERGV